MGKNERRACLEAIRERYRTPARRPKRSLHIKDSSNQLISPQRKKQLLDCHQNLDPFILKKRIGRKPKDIFRLIKVTTNVRKRL